MGVRGCMDIRGCMSVRGVGVRGCTWEVQPGKCIISNVFT